MKLLYMGENIAGIRNLTSYVFRTLENSAKDHFRERNRETLTDFPGEGNSDALEERVLVRELKDVIVRAIDKLEPCQRYVFVETELKGRSYDDLSRETGEKVGTLLSRKSRAVKKLREMIVRYIHEGGEHE